MLPGGTFDLRTAKAKESYSHTHPRTYQPTNFDTQPPTHAPTYPPTHTCTHAQLPEPSESPDYPRSPHDDVIHDVTTPLSPVEEGRTVDERGSTTTSARTPTDVNPDEAGEGAELSSDV